ncbi:MAG: DUF3500 domain-containing protein [Chitinophagaceae bacterium]
MKKQLFLFVLFLLAFFAVIAQPAYAPAYISKAEKLLATISNDSMGALQFPFTDSMRMKWERLPGQRMGFKLAHFTEQQKIAFHELLRACLSTQGYLTVTAVMFNEDIQQKFEPAIGRNEYWVEVFGRPAANNLWSWKLEGHHLSLNFTFRGNKLLSNSPFLMSTNPANSITDSVRAGLIILYKEEEMGRQLVLSLNKTQLLQGYSSRKKTAIVYSEQNKEKIQVPDEGIFYKNLNKGQQAMAKALVAEYFNNFNAGEIPTLDSFWNSQLRFFYVESMEKGKPHYYRFENGAQMIEYENYDNHIHCFWRTDNDFAKKSL